ncbi:zinc finger protein [Colletotrichum truncatum]|uniref:Zinc finger protein n=1 Tax=Colletotrichum truncatum TaxID=5467 RepID=A0ACC3YDK1_COLTU|nr:zinc finger protein [Colletotrichum truncatum]KAF6783031.1 zinc finger protein [Colletotrichum truncatum]
MAFTCGTCWQTWPTWRSRDQHVAAKFHEVPDFECDSCDRYFQSQQAVEQHMNALDHWAESASDEADYYCDYDSCSEGFGDEEELRNHEIEEHFYCDSCDREFQDLNSIKMHRNSKQHRGTNVSCSFCHGSYVTAGGVFHHLEQGACPKAPLDRIKVYEAVRRKDPNDLLTERLLEWSVPSSFEATHKSYNAQAEAFECFLCGNLFKRLNSLNQHLNSPRHQQDLYHCPNPRCDKKFGTLAAVGNHLDSESCNFMRFDDVQETAKRIFDPGRMIAF